MRYTVSKQAIKHLERKHPSKGKCGYKGWLIFIVDDFPKEPGDQGLGGTGCICPETKEKAVLEDCKKCGKYDELRVIHFVPA